MKALQLLLVCLAGWLNRNQQLVIEYLQEGSEGAQGTVGKKATIHRRPAAQAGRQSAEARTGSTAALCLPCQPKDAPGVALRPDRAQLRRQLPPFSWSAVHTR